MGILLDGESAGAEKLLLCSPAHTGRSILGTSIFYSADASLSQAAILLS